MSLDWGRQPATGRSFFKMMLLVVLATGFAVFWVVRSLSEPPADRSAATTPAGPPGGQIGGQK
jgi:hypothetical protein